jgi:hypothetical protein
MPPEMNNSNNENYIDDGTNTKPYEFDPNDLSQNVEDPPAAP